MTANSERVERWAQRHPDGGIAQQPFLWNEKRLAGPKAVHLVELRDGERIVSDQAGQEGSGGEVVQRVASVLNPSISGEGLGTTALNQPPPEAVREAIEEQQREFKHLMWELEEAAIGYVTERATPAQRDDNKKRLDAARDSLLGTHLLALYRARADGETVEGFVNSVHVGDDDDVMIRCPGIDWPIGTPVTVTRRRAAEEESNG